MYSKLANPGLPAKLKGRASTGPELARGRTFVNALALLLLACLLSSDVYFHALPPSIWFCHYTGINVLLPVFLLVVM